MITQTNVPGPESNSSDIIKDMSPQTNIHAPSFEDDEFDIPQVALPAGLDPEKMGANHQVGGQVRQGVPHQYHGHQGGYGDGYYGGGWMGGDPQHYNNQINYYQQYQPQQNQYQPQQHYGYYQHPQEDIYMSQHHHLHHPHHHSIPGPGRSPSGSHSTPSPHSQTDLIEADHQHFSDIKRPQPPLAPESLLQQHPQQPQNVVKKPKPSRRKKKRDPNEPTKPVSAYALFFRDRQASIKGRNPNLSFGEVSKLVASMWDNLDAESKAHYKKRTEMAKKEYLRQLAAYRASIVSKGHGEDMYGYMGYGGNNYHMEANGTMVQNIPPHPHPAQPHPHQKLHPQLGAATYVTNSQDYMNQYQQQQTTAHGTDIATGNQTGGIPSLPVHVVVPPEPGSAPPPPVSSGVGGPGQQHHHVNGGGYVAGQHDHNIAAVGQHNRNIAAVGQHDHNIAAGQHDRNIAVGQHDRNHNTVTGSPMTCSRSGCSNSVTKSMDGTESTYCSSDCVVDQCRDAYQGWEHQQQQQHHNHSTPAQPPTVK